MERSDLGEEVRENAAERGPTKDGSSAPTPLERAFAIGAGRTRVQGGRRAGVAVQ